MSLKGFNLLRKQSSPPTAWEKIYGWVLGTARVIVIVVELIVVASFVTRVVVDTQAKQLDKKLETRELSMAAFADAEADYRLTQKKTGNYKMLWQNSSDYATVLKELENYLNANFTNMNISIIDQELTIRAEGDVDKISIFEAQMKNSESFVNVETFELDRDSSGGRRASFGLRAVIIDKNRESISPSSV